MSQAVDDAVETLKRFLSAVASQNHAHLMTFLDEDAQMFSPLGSHPARLDGRAAIGEQFEAMMERIKSQPAGSIDLDPQDLSARELAPDVVLITFHLRLPGPLQRRSCIMTRDAGEWSIAHIHASFASPV
jgi:ketosteroid isomerase-like protein